MSSWSSMGLKEKIEYCQMVVRSGMLPKGLTTPEAVLVLIETGDELGLQPMQALRSINVTNGRLMLSADIAVALCLKNPKCDYFIATNSDEKSCTFETSREGKVQSLTYTLEQAKKAGLASREMWQKYPAEMLRARAKISLARLVFSDVLAGVYTEDEVSAESSHVAPIEVSVPQRQQQVPTPAISNSANVSNSKKQQLQAAKSQHPIAASTIVPVQEKVDENSQLAVPANSTQEQSSNAQDTVAEVVGSVVEKVTSVFEGAVAVVSKPKNRVPSPVGDDLTDEEAIAEYTAWIEEIEHQAQLDQLLFRLKFEEERENVKQAIRPVFKAKSDFFKQQDKQKKEAAQSSAEPFRPESDNATSR